MAGFTASFVVLLTILFLMKLFYYLPKVSIASIIIVASAKLVEYHDIVFLYKIGAWKEIVLAAITLVITFLFGPEIGILVALAMSLFLLVKSASAPPVTILGVVDDDPDPDTRFRDISYFSNATLINSVMILRIEDSLSFANINSLRDMISRAEKLGSHCAHPTDLSILDSPVLCILLDCRNIPHIDAQALQVLSEMFSDHTKRGVELCFIMLRPKLQERLLHAVDAHHPDQSSHPLKNHLFPSIVSALDSFQAKIE